MDFTLIILAAGLSSRYGGVKQLEPVGPSGEALLDYAVYNAARSGFDRVVFVIQRELEQAFREHVGGVFGDSISIRYAFQELESLPNSRAVPPGRHKPWGTGHALLVAEKEIPGPFAVSNADDYYSASAYALLRDHFHHLASHREAQFALVGYRLRDTLSAAGGVSRGVCECDDAGFLIRVIEVKQIKVEHGRIAGVTLKGNSYPLTGDETIAMNLWGLTPAIFPMLKRQFARFLEHAGSDLVAEFLIGSAVNAAIAASQARVKVLPGCEPGFGITFSADKESVVATVKRLVSSGRIPENLAESLRPERRTH